MSFGKLCVLGVLLALVSSVDGSAPLPARPLRGKCSVCSPARNFSLFVRYVCCSRPSSTPLGALCLGIPSRTLAVLFFFFLSSAFENADVMRLLLLLPSFFRSARPSQSAPVRCERERDVNLGASPYLKRSLRKIRWRWFVGCRRGGKKFCCEHPFVWFPLSPSQNSVSNQSGLVFPGKLGNREGNLDPLTLWIEASGPLLVEGRSGSFQHIYIRIVSSFTVEKGFILNPR